MDYIVEPTQLKALAEQGWRIMPLLKGNKIPVLKDWPQQATNNWDEISAWLIKYPGSNWGVATGSGSGFFVLDIDPKNGGLEAWAALQQEHGELNNTVTCITGTQGIHYYFKMPKTGEVHNSSGQVGTGIDIRGEGGQVVIPESIHPNGNRYTWSLGRGPEDTEIADAPPWLLKIVVGKKGREDYPNLGGTLEKGKRNDAIYSTALKAARSKFDRDILFVSIQTWLKSQGQADMPEDEIRATIDSAYQKIATEDKEELKFAKSDSFNAEVLINAYGKELLFIHGLGWYSWSGRHWKRDDGAHILYLAGRAMKEYEEEQMRRAASASQSGSRIFYERAKWAVGSQNLGRLQAMVKIAESRPSIQKTIEQMDQGSSFMVNFRNGTLNLKTGKLKAHDRNDLITKLVNYDYLPDADCPTFKETLNLSFNGDKPLIDYLQRALGYTITGDTSEQAVFIAWGEAGNNGKSTILEAVMRILGKGYAQMSDVSVVTSRDKANNRIASSLAKMQGTRMINMNEADEGVKFSEALLKQMTGGDTIQACYKYQEPFEYTPEFKLWIRTNEKPAIRGASDSIWRRIQLVPFEHVIPKEKRKHRGVIDNALSMEAEGILSWLVEGAKLWMKHGLQSPSAVTGAVQSYREENDIVTEFIMDCTVERAGKTCSRASVYNAFKSWMRDQGYRYALVKRTFNTRFAKATVQQGTRKMVSGEYVWQDVELNSNGQKYASML